jgi:transcriptional regulator EpsA
MAQATLADPSIVDQADSLLSLFQAALSARGQVGWSRWLQGEIQVFLPHDALIVAWGDFRSGELAYDVITRSPSLSPHAMPRHEIEGVMIALYDRWLAAGQEPVVIAPRELPPQACAAISLARCGLAHGLQDHRRHYDSMYLFLGPQELASAFSRQLSRMLLPFIDTGLRQLADRGQKQAQVELSGTGFSCSSFAEVPEADAPHHGAAEPGFGDSQWAEAGAGERGSPLSARELEVMQWVRLGKTNSEIAMILNLSTFTVKNHMRRIYKKLDVLNRAQAVGNLDRMQSAPQFAGR